MIKIAKNLIKQYFIVLLFVAALMGGIIAHATTQTTELTVPLLRADGFAVLAGSTITNTGTTVITGDLGLSPGTSVTGTSTLTVNGTQHIADTAAANAQTDLVTAYNDAAGRTTATPLAGGLLTGTLTPGVYSLSAPVSNLTDTVTLDAGGNPNAVFVFQAASTLITSPGSKIILAGGAQPCNIFWTVGSSATLDTTTEFKGTILANASITLNNGATVEGRLLAGSGAITLINNTVNNLACASAPVVPVPTTGSSTNPPLISITKVPSPLALPSGPGSVTYTYTVLNIGTAPMDNVTVTDNKCSSMNFVSGDANKNNVLNTDETWTYNCVASVDKTTTNTATATGYANGLTAVDTANATVVVSMPIVPPLINVVKKPSQFVLPIGGGPVVYTYTITNPGTAPLSNVSVADNKCTGLPIQIINHPGDLDNDNLLDSNETWNFTCNTNITANTVNTATAQGSANGLTAVDYALATVVVNTPGLPNTGIGPDDKNVIWNIINSAGVIAALLLFFITRKKQAI